MKAFGMDGSVLVPSVTTGKTDPAEAGVVFAMGMARCTCSVLGGLGLGITVGPGGSVDSACMNSGSLGRNRSPVATSNATNG